ncbi:hypothetical protein ACLM5H_11380 [Fredinandcohnia humi]
MSNKKKDRIYLEVEKTLKDNPPKIIGDYKKQGWALKALEKTSNEDIEKEANGKVTAKAVLEAKDGTYYPAFLLLDIKKSGKIIDCFFLAESNDHFDLIPLQLAQEFFGKDSSEVMPFKYRTLAQIKGDRFQTNWPDFS